MNAAVFVHRWFERGAGWAYAPDAGERITLVVSALDSHLKAGKPGGFQIPLVGDEYLVGAVAADPDCLDPKARERKPTILRAAILHGEQAPAQVQAISKRLAECWPTQPGPDANLIITIPVRPPGHESKPARSEDGTKSSPVEKQGHTGDTLSTGPTRSRWIMRWLRMRIKPVLVAVLLVVVASFAVPFASRFAPATRPSGKETFAEGMMKKQLQGWGIRAEDMKPDVVTRYFRFLSQAELGKAVPEANHPYVRFVGRLPKTPAKPKDGHWSDNEVKEALTELIKKLNPSAANITSEDALAWIAMELDYEAWRKTSINEDPEASFARAPGNDVAGYVERFRKGSSIPGDIVDEMRRCLKAWRVTKPDGVEIEHAREFTVVRTFFQTLSRPSESLKGLTDADKEHAYWTFLRRLPEVNCKVWTGDDVKAEVERVISEIASALHENAAGKTDVSKIDKIRRTMNYDDWLKNQDTTQMKTEGEPGCESLKLLVDQFRPGKR